MKTSILTTALVVLTTLAFSQLPEKSEEAQNYPASEKVIYELVTNHQDQLILVLKKETNEKVTVKLKKENGTLIHQKVLRKAENNRLTYDISALPEGKYQFEIKSGKNIICSKTLNKSAATIAMTDK